MKKSNTKKITKYSTDPTLLLLYRLHTGMLQESGHLDYFAYVFFAAASRLEPQIQNLAIIF